MQIFDATHLLTLAALAFIAAGATLLVQRVPEVVTACLLFFVAGLISLVHYVWWPYGG